MIFGFIRIISGALLLVSFWLLVPRPSFAADVAVDVTGDVTLRSLERLGADRWRIVLPLPRPTRYSVFEVNRSDRVIIDILDEKIIAKQCLISGAPLVRCRAGRGDYARARFMLDFSTQVKIERASLEQKKTGAKESFFLDIVLVRADGAKPFLAQKPLRQVKLVKGIKQIKNRVIIIDPGHGGSNIGASFAGVDEKDLMLTFARELRDQLASHSGFSVFLTRNDDRYLPLKDRVLFARRHHADALISIHADWNANPQVKGLAVYSLSNRSAGKYARVFIENDGAQIIGGEEWRNSLPSAHDILFDLTQRETLGKSIALGRSILKQVRLHTALLDQPHRFADLRLLSAPDLPAVLIEAGFLSHAGDMNRLMSKKWRRKLSAQIARGLKDYFKQVNLAGL